MTGVLMRTERLGDAQTQGEEGGVKRKAVAIMLPPAKEH